MRHALLSGLLGGLIGSVLTAVVLLQPGDLGGEAVAIQSGYFEVYGVDAQGQSYRIGDSEDTDTFSVAGFDRFLLVIPPTSQVAIDAIALGDRWAQSQPGPEFAHHYVNLRPSDEPSAKPGRWVAGDSYTEGPPDNLSLRSIVGRESRYGFSTLGAATLRVVLAGTSEEG